MRAFLIAAAVVSLAGSALATDVGVSVSIGQPGFYGRIVLGNVPAPRVIYSAPVIVQQMPVAVARQPIYLRVPPGHEKNWSKHCRQYGACGQPVYFVRNDWYRDVYAPAYRSDRDRDGFREERRDRQDDHDHGKRKKKKSHGRD